MRARTSNTAVSKVETRFYELTYFIEICGSNQDYRSAVQLKLNVVDLSS